MTAEGIERQLRQMKEQGIGGVEIMSCWRMYEKGNLPYLSDAHLAMIRHAVGVAGSLDMEVSLTLGPGWAFGGFWVPPEDRSKVLVVSSAEVAGPRQHAGILPGYAPPPVEHDPMYRLFSMQDGFWAEAPDEGRVVAVVAGRVFGDRIAGDTLVDLTGRVRDGGLVWRVPEGAWRLMVFRLKYTGQQSAAQDFRPANWVVDQLNPGAVRRYCDRLGGAFFEAVGEEFGDVVDSMFCDSFEVLPFPDSVLWTNEVVASFIERKGYDPSLYLPAIWWDIGELTPRIRHDVNEHLHHLGLLSLRAFDGWCEEHGTAARLQPHYRFPTELVQAAGAVSRPETEVTTTRFEVRAYPRKSTASGARFYGREGISAEAYTFIHRERYRTTLEELKIATDAFLRDGVVQFYNHGYLYSPEKSVAPSRDLPWGNRISHWNTWWKYYRHVADYVARCCHMMRQGDFVADVLVYSPQAEIWGEKVLYGNERRVIPYGDLPETLVANGYDFDVVNDDVLQNHATIEGGSIRVRDLSYRVLVLPAVGSLPRATSEFIDRFVRAGGTLIALQRVPDQAVGLRGHGREDRHVLETMRDLFGPTGLGRDFRGGGRTTFIPELEVRERPFDPTMQEPHRPLPPLEGGRLRLVETLHGVVPPDVVAEDGGQSEGVAFIHRRDGDRDIYFIANLKPQDGMDRLRFRPRDKVPERWDPLTGHIEPLWEYRCSEAGTIVRLDLAPYESTFVLFRSPDGDRPHVTRSNLARVREVTRDRAHGVVERAGPVRVEAEVDGEPRQGSTQVGTLPAAVDVAGPWRRVLTDDRQVVVDDRLGPLGSWADEPGTRYFSGSGRYVVDFELAAPYVAEEVELVLDLGSVGDVAEVNLDGTSVGVRWMQPYRFEITRAVHRGRNRLEVLVTNTLINHVAGLDEAPPVPEELVPHYGRGADVYPQGRFLARQERGFEPIPPSGLIGPVRVLPRVRVSVPLRSDRGAGHAGPW